MAACTNDTAGDLASKGSPIRDRETVRQAPFPRPPFLFVNARSLSHMHLPVTNYAIRS